MPDTEPDLSKLFTLFTEIGIIAQLSGRLFERRLPDGFLMSHFTVLNHLARMGDGRTPLSIATALQVPKTTLTHTLAGLRTAGLITFAPNPRDSRSKCVMLTDAGRGFRQTAIAAMGADMARMAQTIPVDRLDPVLPLLAEVRRYLDAERDGPDGVGT